jgi:hypothetical protein
MTVEIALGLSSFTFKLLSGRFEKLFAAKGLLRTNIQI